MRASAFHSFCDRVGRGQFPQFNDRGDLWRLLATITARRQSRGSVNKLGRSGAAARWSASRRSWARGAVDEGMAQVLGREPAPEEAAQFNEDMEHLLDALGDAKLRTIALRKTGGIRAAEIAGQLGISARTVDRKLELIREIWRENIE